MWHVLKDTLGCRGIRILLSKNLHARRSASMFDDDQLIGFDLSLARVLIYLSTDARRIDSSLLALHFIIVTFSFGRVLI